MYSCPPEPEGAEMLRSVSLNLLHWIYFMSNIQHCFICRPSDSTVSEDAGIEPGTVANKALAVRRSNHSARYHPHCKFGSYQYQI